MSLQVKSFVETILQSYQATNEEEYFEGLNEEEKAEYLQQMEMMENQMKMNAEE